MQLDRFKNLAETVITEMPGQRGQWIQQTSSSSMIPREEVAMQYVNNRTSVQTVEEFSLGFLQDCATSRVAPAMPGVAGNHKKRVGIYDNHNRHHSYEDLAIVLGLQRMNSECGSDVIKSASAKGLMENGILVNNGIGLRNEEKSSWRRLGNDVNGICHDQVGLGLSASHLTESQFGQSSQPSALGVSDGSQSGKIKILCSFAGNIMPRPSDGKLRYVGGETRIISIRKDISWEELVKKTSEICNQPHTIRYQLPGEDLDALISVSSDEDLQNMLEECYSIQKLGDSQRLRIFLIPLTESEKASAIDPTIIQQGDPNYQYVVAVNGVTGVNLNPQVYCSGQSLASDISPLAPALNQSAGFQVNSLSSGNTSQIVSGLGFQHSTEFINESRDTIRQAKQYAPLSPVIIQQGDVKNDYPQFPKEKLSPGSSTGSMLVSTAMLPPEASHNNIIPYYDIPQVVGNLVNLSDNASKNDVVQATKVVGPPSYAYDLNRETSASPVLELNNSNFQQCSVEPVTDGRIFHSEKHLSRPDDVMGVLLASEDSTCLNHRMPHTFSDSKLQEFGGSSAYSSHDRICPSFSLNMETPQLSVLTDLREKPIQQHKNIEIFNPHVQSRVQNVEPVVSNQGMNCRNVPLGPEFISKTESVLWDVHGNDENCQSAKAKSHKHEPMMEEHNENFSTCELKNDNRGHFHDNKSSFSAAEVMKLMPCVNDIQIPHVGLNNLKKNIQVHGGAVPVSQVAKLEIDVTMEQNLNNQLASSRTPRGESPSNTSCAMNLETLGVIHNSEEKSSDANCATALISELGVGPVSHNSSMQLPIACQNDMVLKEPIVTNCTQSSPPAVLDDSGQTRILNSSDTNNLNQDAAFRREYTFLGDAYIYNAEQDVAICGENNCLSDKQKDRHVSFSKFQKSAAVFEAGNISTAESATVLHQEDIVHTDGPVPSPLEAENTLQELALESENSNYGRIKESITDAMIAEKEAGAYGLQIIKNADLEELRELGSGTYGTVYHGRWRGSDVAIKRIRKTCFTGRSSEQERLIKDFWREAQILSNLHHPNVVALYGVVPDGPGGTLATVTEYMAHGSLRSVLLKKDRVLDGHKKLVIAMDAAFGMEYLHSKNIIHFDLKCDNLLVDLRDPQRPICKVGDFGLSKIKRNTLVTGGIRGTLPWMAPELLNGSTNLVSEKVDVFSFGVATWEILTGQEPYANMHYGAIIGGIVKNTLRPPVPERCEPEWRKLMEQCWSTDPEERPSFTEITRKLRSMSAVLQA